MINACCSHWSRAIEQVRSSPPAVALFDLRIHGVVVLSFMSNMTAI
jgi:hypothetical protein